MGFPLHHPPNFPSSAMNILVLTLRIPYPPNDGGALAMYGLMEALSHGGHQLSVAALNTQKHRQDPSALQDVARQVFTTEVDTTVRVLPVLLNAAFGRTAYNINRFYDAKHEKLLKQLLQAQQFDLIQLEGVYLAHYLPTIKAYTDAPVVLRAHNVEYAIWERLAAAETEGWKRLYYNMLARRGKRFEVAALSGFDGILPISPKDAQKFRELGYKGPMHLLPMGLDPSRYPQAPAEKAASPANTPLQVASLSSLEWTPNVQGLRWFLNEVWPLVRKAVPNAEFHVAGKNPSAEVRAWREPGLVVHGQVADAHAFLRRYPIQVVPLLAGSGLRVKLLENFALGRAVVTTSVGMAGIPAEDGLQLLIADKPEAFAEAILRLHQNQDLRQQMQQTAYEWVMQRYSWAALLPPLEEFYHTVREQRLKSTGKLESPRSQSSSAHSSSAQAPASPTA